MQLVKHRHTIELIFKLRAIALLIFYIFMHERHITYKQTLMQ